jgi:hypothetical protein
MPILGLATLLLTGRLSPFRLIVENVMLLGS